MSPALESVVPRYRQLAAYADALTTYQENHWRLVASLRDEHIGCDEFDRQATELCRELQRLKRWKVMLDREKADVGAEEVLSIAPLAMLGAR